VRALGYILIAVGFLAASLIAVQSPDNVVNWSWFVPALVLSAAGVALARFATRQETRAEGALGADVEVLHESLGRVMERITRLDEEKMGLNPYDLHGKIDELFPEELTRFVDARQSIAHVYGLQAYARVMTEFAAAERYLNRVWSASVDGYIDEVQEYIGRARTQFGVAQQKLRDLGPAGGPGN
jgi:hypothetical protein